MKIFYHFKALILISIIVSLEKNSYSFWMNYNDFYDVLEQTDNAAKIKLSTQEHPIFQAHFPTQPVLPGFIHFDLVEKLFCIKIVGIKKAKFLQMVLPEQELVYKKDGNSFKVYNCDQEVANFSLKIEI
jgi:3-hydroxyacyl-[acyl-carrier-protein] dehydratase